MLRVSIEGNIGAGKSELLARVKPLLKASVVTREEHIDEWSRGGAESLFNRYNKDPKKYAFLFQMNALADRAMEDVSSIVDSRQKEDRQCTSVHVTERSRASDRLFAIINHDAGHMDDEQFSVYDKQFKALMTLAPVPYDVIILIKTRVSDCIDNVRLRNRLGEEDISTDYLERLDELHTEEYFAGFCKKGKVAVWSLPFIRGDEAAMATMAAAIINKALKQ